MDKVTRPPIIVVNPITGVKLPLVVFAGILWQKRARDAAHTPGQRGDEWRARMALKRIARSLARNIPLETLDVQALLPAQWENIFRKGDTYLLDLVEDTNPDDAIGLEGVRERSRTVASDGRSKDASEEVCCVNGRRAFTIPCTGREMMCPVRAEERERQRTLHHDRGRGGYER